MTTIKVPKPLRERVAREATRRGLTAAGFISELIDEHDRHARFDAVRHAYAASDPTYVDETAVWESLAADGLES